MHRATSYLSEPVALPGMPDLIVTRAYVYQWAIDRGYPAAGGFNSADYLAFGRPTSRYALDATDYRDACVAMMDRSLSGSSLSETERCGLASAGHADDTGVSPSPRRA